MTAAATASTPRPPVLATRGLTAGYGGVAVVHDVDITVGAGEVVALLGANGAGKTTTLLAISGLASTLAGEVTIAGPAGGPSARATADPRWGRARWETGAGRVRRLARSGLAHVPEDRALFGSLTPRETLRLATSRRRLAAATDDAVGWFPPLARVLDRPTGLLSGGEQQMVALARALVTEPRLLMIDELSLGLAPLVVDALLPVVREAASRHGTAVLLVEQHVPAALAVADRAYVLRRGRVVVADDARALRANRAVLEASYLGGT